MPNLPYVTRFAPSPSGLLHLGNARTALLSYLAARKSKGRFILRIEDTDEARSTETHVQAVLEDLRWFGLDWDEGPDVGGPHEYRQRHRRAIHETWLAKLDAAGSTYPCFCTPAELSLSRKRLLAAGKPPRYAGTCRALDARQRAARLASGEPAALRFQVPAGQVVTFRDLVHGEQRFPSDDIGDFIIRRADGGTAFFFSNAIDDALMGITLVLRGDDHLTNTPRQILILQALGLPVPEYAHVALLLDMDGAPLSKRQGAQSLGEFRERGFLPGALRNHLVRLGHACQHDGWLDDAAMCAEFELSRLGKAAAKFDEAQLHHWQKEAVAQLSQEDFLRWIGAYLPPGLDASHAAAFAHVVRPNIEFARDVQPWAEVAFGRLTNCAPEAVAAIEAAGEAFYAMATQVFAQPGLEFKQRLRELGQTSGRKGPALFMPLRAALTGMTHGPELAGLLQLVPGEEVQARLAAARQRAGSGAR